VNTATSSLLFPRRALRLYTGFSDLIDKLQPLFALALRIYIFRVFFWSGLPRSGVGTQRLRCSQTSITSPHCRRRSPRYLALQPS